MTSCDLCGKPATTKARIEGALLSVCASCASHGMEIRTPQPVVKYKPVQQTAETYHVGDMGQRLRQARQRMKLSEKDAALKLNIKESTLLHLEANKMHPDDALTKKLEKFYGIKLTEQA